MNPIIRTVSIAAFALTATFATVAGAQTNGSGSSTLHRNSGETFSYGRGGANGGTFSSGNTGNDTGFGRPQPRSVQGAVTPVPEPSEWAMMLAGLALVGFIVRRNANRS